MPRNESLAAIFSYAEKTIPSPFFHRSGVEFPASGRHNTAR
jgi:hypothetical protein